MFFLRRVLLAALIPSLFILASTALGGSALSFPDADTSLFERDPTYNFGRDEDVPCGTLGVLGDFARSRMLIRFNIAADVPAGATITSAKLRLHVTRQPTSDAVNSRFALYRLFAPWSEGVQSGAAPGGAPADDGEITWNSEVWEEPGGEIGGDTAEDESASNTLGDIGEYIFEFNQDGIGDLQAMLDNPALNRGWMLATTLEDRGWTGKRIATREHDDLSPVLEINFEDPASDLVPSEVTKIEESDGNVALFFSVVPEQSYTVQKSSDLSGWVDVETLGPYLKNTIVEFVDTNISEDRSFYRIVSEP